jgi:hypothetical protein
MYYITALEFWCRLLDTVSKWKEYLYSWLNALLWKLTHNSDTIMFTYFNSELLILTNRY